MNEILDDEKYSVEERLEMVKELLKIKDQQLVELKQKYEKLQSDHSWQRDQQSNHRMGL